MGGWRWCQRRRRRPLFAYKHQGSLAYIGDDQAVISIPNVGFVRGWLAGSMWKARKRGLGLGRTGWRTLAATEAALPASIFSASVLSFDSFRGRSPSDRSPISDPFFFPAPPILHFLFTLRTFVLNVLNSP